MELLHGFVGTLFGHKLHKSIPTLHEDHADGTVIPQVSISNFPRMITLNKCIVPSVLAGATRLFDQRAGMYLYDTICISRCQH